MSYLEAAWDGSVERVSDALRAGVHADTIMPVSVLVLWTHHFYIYVSQQGQYFSNHHNFTTSYIMCANCKNTGVLLDMNSCVVRAFKCKTANGLRAFKVSAV